MPPPLSRRIPDGSLHNCRIVIPLSVIVALAGIQSKKRKTTWMPVFTGMDDLRPGYADGIWKFLFGFQERPS
jgi:hypothetical protein